LLSCWEPVPDTIRRGCREPRSDGYCQPGCRGDTCWRGMRLPPSCSRIRHGAAVAEPQLPILYAVGIRGRKLFGASWAHRKLRACGHSSVSHESVGARSRAFIGSAGSALRWSGVRIVVAGAHDVRGAVVPGSKLLNHRQKVVEPDYATFQAKTICRAEAVIYRVDVLAPAKPG